MYNHLLINVDELWLKGKNRPHYFRKLHNQVVQTVKAFVSGSSYQVKNQNQRLVISFDDAVPEDVINYLAKLPGIFSITPSLRVGKTMPEIIAGVKKELDSLEKIPATFKVYTKRSDKTFSLNSMETSQEIGGQVLKAYPQLKVDVHNPLLKLEVKILREGAYIATREILGIGGLPCGTSGHLVTMISGGFDSPVASYLMSKRGCQQTLAFFYAYPFVGEEVQEKIIEIAKKLAAYQQGVKLYIIPFGSLQKKISKICKEEYRTVLFRKLMVEASNMIASKVKASAILTGDALGQVSSQTIGNLSLMDQASRRPILRPLIGFNKREIIALSQKIGIHDISVIPHDDACSLFAPKHPIIKPDFIYWNEFSKENDLSDELYQAVKEAEIINISFTGEILSDE